MKRWTKCPLLKEFTAADPPFYPFLYEKVDEILIAQGIHRCRSTFSPVFVQKGGRNTPHTRNSPLPIHLSTRFRTKRWTKYSSHKEFTVADPPFHPFLYKKVDEVLITQGIHRCRSTFPPIFVRKGGRSAHYTRKSPLLIHLFTHFCTKR